MSEHETSATTDLRALFEHCEMEADMHTSVGLYGVVTFEEVFEKRGAEWLAAHDAQVKADALEEAADVYEALPEDERTYFPAIHSRWLRKRAASLRQEGDKR